MKIITILNLLFGTFLFHLSCIVLLSYSINQSIDSIYWQETHVEWTQNDDETCPNRDLFAEMAADDRNILWQGERYRLDLDDDLHFDKAHGILQFEFKGEHSFHLGHDSWATLLRDGRTVDIYHKTTHEQIQITLNIQQLIFFKPFLTHIEWFGMVRDVRDGREKYREEKIVLSKRTRSIIITVSNRREWILPRDLNHITIPHGQPSVTINGLKLRGDVTEAEYAIEIKLNNGKTDLQMDFFKALISFFNENSCIHIDNRQFDTKHKDENCVVYDKNWVKHEYTLKQQYKDDVFEVKDVSDGLTKVLKLYDYFLPEVTSSFGMDAYSDEGQIAIDSNMNWYITHGIHGFRGFLVMDSFGKTLWEYLSVLKASHMSDTELELWLINCELDIINQLQRIHGAKYIHRDIKAENVMIGDDEKCALIDFGLGISFDQVRSALSGSIQTVKENIFLEGSSARPVDYWYLFGQNEQKAMSIGEILDKLPRILDYDDLNAMFVKAHNQLIPTDELKLLRFDFESGEQTAINENKKVWYKRFEKALWTDYSKSKYTDLSKEPTNYKQFLIQQCWAAEYHSDPVYYKFKHGMEDLTNLETFVKNLKSIREELIAQ